MIDVRHSVDVPTVPSGEAFQQARKALGATQQEVAEHADCSQATVSKVERGNGSVEARRCVADALTTLRDTRKEQWK